MNHRLFLIALLLCLYTSFCRAQTTLPATRPAQTEAERWARSFERDKNGFTIFPVGRGARIVLLSSSEGIDAGDGFDRPVRTLKKAMSLVRMGYPDRVLFKRGDVFDMPNMNDVIQTGGRSPREPMILGAYGDLSQPRPVIRATLSLGGRQKPMFLVLQDLDLYGDSLDPAQPGFEGGKVKNRQDYGIYMFCPGQYLWIEGCRSHFFITGICLMSKPREHFHNVVIRRCSVTDCYDSGGGHSQGMYIDCVDDCLIEDNLFDHNGWNEAVNGAGKNIFNHNIYLQHGALGEDRHFIVRNNISARASSHGCQLRPGGLLENNLFLKNPLAAFVSYAPSIVRDNVILDADNIGPREPRGQGLEFLNCPTILADGNIIAHKIDKSNNLAAMGYNPIIRDEPPAPSNGEFRNNIVFDWPGESFNTHSDAAALNMHDNILSGDGIVVSLHAWHDGYKFANNQYASPSAQPFCINGQNMDWTAWSANTGDTSAMKPVNFVDSSRDIASYAASIGLADATLEGFLAAAREQHRGHWDARLTAGAVNDYIREGFKPKQ